MPDVQFVGRSGNRTNCRNADVKVRSLCGQRPREIRRYCDRGQVHPSERTQALSIIQFVCLSIILVIVMNETLNETRREVLGGIRSLGISHGLERPAS